MGTFNTKKTLYASSALIPVIADRIRSEFENEKYEVEISELSSGGCDISITKGGVFKAVLGMKSALKITLLPQTENISFEATVGIWGQQAIPTVISMFFFWPVIITQIWGMITQANLDDKALEIAKDVISDKLGYMNAMAPSEELKFCTECGQQNSKSANFCCGCGKKL